MECVAAGPLGGVAVLLALQRNPRHEASQTHLAQMQQAFLLQSGSADRRTNKSTSQRARWLIWLLVGLQS